MLSCKYKSTKPGRELKVSDIKNLLYKLVETHGSPFIVLDAMDECDISGSGERWNLIEVFETLLTLQTTIKIFFSSRYKSDIRDHMGSWPTIRVTASATKDDLNNYINYTIDRKLGRKEDCTLEDRNLLKVQLKDRAKGM